MLYLVGLFIMDLVGLAVLYGFGECLIFTKIYPQNWQVNVMGQFFLLNSFIGRGFALWGWTAIQSLWTGDGWHDSPVFPRVSLCDFRVRRLANMHRYTVLCYCFLKDLLISRSNACS